MDVIACDRPASLSSLLEEITHCQRCQGLPLGPRPVLRAHAGARILIVGQAPGTRVHNTGIPWNDPSGERLRNWMNVSCETFYDESRIAIIPMAFCYPGKGKSGDLPPRKECAPHWHPQLLEHLNNIELVLLIGQYAMGRYLGAGFTTVTETVARWQEAGPKYFPLVHPSPRNKLWLRRNPWFEAEVIPELRQRVQGLL